MATETLPAVRAEEPQLTPFEVIERVITTGDLARMTPQDRVAFYWRTCESLGLNPLTRPFEFISLNNKLTLYVRKDATEQLRAKHGVTVTELRREKDPELGIYTVYAHGRTRDGREDEATGVVTIKGLSGEALANALMKAETKAKRRLSLSLVGLGFLDESEVEGGERVSVDPDTGEISEPASKPSLLDRVNRQREVLATKPGETIEGEIVDEPNAPAAGMTAAAPTPAAESSPQARPPADNSDLLEGLDEETGAAAAGVTADQLKAALRERRIDAGYAVEVAKRLFPGVSDVRLLEDGQRAQLLAELTKED